MSVQGAFTVAGSPAQMGKEICSGEEISVGQDSRGAIRLASSQTVVRVNQNSTFVIEPSGLDGSLLKLLKGVLYLFSRRPESFDVETPYINAAIEGTEFVVQVTDDQTVVTVIEGRVRTHNTQGEISVSQQQAVVAEAGSAPRLLEIVEPENAVKWALYYQPILYALFDPAAAQGALSTKVINTNLDVADALTRLELVPQENRNDSYHNYSAALNLAVGQVDAATFHIKQAFRSNPNSADAFALQSVVAVTENKPNRAQSLAKRAVAADSNSSAALIALSYAQQAIFEIDQALASARTAISKDPGNALAWSRLAELWLSHGYYEKALQAAQRAVELSPGVARTQSVLGFANLIATNFEAAIKSFDQAIDLDQSDPLPRLGRGLVSIRKGKLKEGREELETAVSLDPANALLRSYLGKAYFEEKQLDLAGEQYTLAKQFDPMDPTAYYYDAIRNHSDNRPLDALDELGQAIALNDRRAVYRSRLLLDEDRAARGSSLAQLYANLGFRKLALNEASRSLLSDPSNHSAHRFLSDAYAQFDRQEISRSSALLQAQLLQPINVVPVPPRLGGNDLNLALSTDSSRLSFNEFTSLFERNRTMVSANAIVGTQGTLSDELILSGISNRFSYSLGQFHYESDGFRANNDVVHDIYNIYLQYELSNSLGLQAEYRNLNTSQGDIAYNFDQDDFQLDDRRDTEEETVRLGLRKDFSPRMKMITSLTHIEREVDESKQPSPTLLTEEFTVSEGSDGQVQFLYSGNAFNFIAGAGWYSVENNQDSAIMSIDLETGELAPLRDSQSRPDAKQYNSYFYSSIAAMPSLILQVGASYDTYEDGLFDISEANYKLGTNLEISENVTLRGAAFSTTKRALVADQTLEPTQIAGFNQQFDDFNGTQSDVLGVGIDSRISDETFLGMEIFQRQLSVPSGGNDPLDQDELTTTAYFYQALHPAWFVALEPRYEDIDGDRLPVSQVDTLSVPVAFRYYSKSGIFGAFETNFVRHRNQIEEDDDNGEHFLVSRKDNFVITNLTWGYRLKNGLGEFRFEVRNILDKSFNYQDLNPFKSEPRLDDRYPPERQVFATLKLFF